MLARSLCVELSLQSHLCQVSQISEVVELVKQDPFMSSDPFAMPRREPVGQPANTAWGRAATCAHLNMPSRAAAVCQGLSLTLSSSEKMALMRNMPKGWIPLLILCMSRGSSETESLLQRRWSELSARKVAWRAARVAKDARDKLTCPNEASVGPTGLAVDDGPHEPDALTAADANDARVAASCASIVPPTGQVITHAHKDRKGEPPVSCMFVNELVRCRNEVARKVGWRDGGMSASELG